MRQQISFLTQSRFYSPAFNSAIFDGPVRIYFAQYQEPTALKVYFKAQQRIKDVNHEVREAYRRMNINIFVMLYPTSETFQMSFTETIADTPVARLGRDFVIGASAQMTDTDVDQVCERIYEIACTITESIPVSLLQPEAEELSL